MEGEGQLGRTGAARGRAALLLALLAVSWLPHLPALRAGFTFDDRDFVERNQSVRSLASALAGFDDPFPPEQPEGARYRPVTNFSYALDRAVAGSGPRGHHAANVLLYGVVACLAWALARRVLPSRRAAAIAALVFAAHPVHCEVVDSIAGRSELLALLFGLASATLFLDALGVSGGRSRATRPLHAAAGVAAAAACYALAALGKETAVLLPGVLGVGALLLAPTAWRRVAAGILPFLAVAVAYAVVRASILPLSPSHTVLGDAAPATQLFTMGAVYLEYLRLLVFPDTLQVDFYYNHVIGLQHGPTPQALAGMAAFAATVAALVWSVRRARLADPRPDAAAQRARSAAFALVWFGGFLLPVSHLIPFGALLAERFLFSPSLGAALLLGLVVDAAFAAARAPARRRALWAGAMLVLVALGARTALRASEWRDPVTLWTPVERVVQDDFRVYNNLASGHLGRGDLPAAVAALQRSLALEPDNPVALTNLGFALLELGRDAEAGAVYERVVALDPDEAVAWNGLGVVDARAGRLAEAIAHYDRALRANPNHARARENRAAARAARERARRFLAESGEAARSGSDPALLQRLAAACRATGDAACERDARARAATLVTARSRATPAAR